MPSACCRWMASDLSRSCENHPDRFYCPDALIDRRADGTYGLIVHDGGSSSISIKTCPWCGTDLDDGRVLLTVSAASDEHDGPAVSIDAGPFLSRVGDDLLSDGYASEWAPDVLEGIARRAAVDVAGVQSVHDAIARRRSAGDLSAGDWAIDELAADRWVIRNRSALTR